MDSRTLRLTLIIFLLLPGLPLADDRAQVERLLAADDPPFGVVFEVVEHDEDALTWAMPRIAEYARRLRQRFPDIGLAVVTHGREEFGLLRERAAENRAVHQTVQALVAEDVPVHVCGTHASWRNKTADDFPDYVDVAPAGPTEIRNYQAMGYELVELQAP